MICNYLEPCFSRSLCPPVTGEFLPPKSKESWAKSKLEPHIAIDLPVPSSALVMHEIGTWARQVQRGVYWLWPGQPKGLQWAWNWKQIWGLLHLMPSLPMTNLLDECGTQAKWDQTQDAGYFSDLLCKGFLVQWQKGGDRRQAHFMPPSLPWPWFQAVQKDIATFKGHFYFHFILFEMGVGDLFFN